MTGPEHNRAVLETLFSETLPGAGIPDYGVTPLRGFTRLAKRGRVRLPEDGTVLVFLLPYYAGDFPGRNLSLHAVGRDYHSLARALLAPTVRGLGERFPDRHFLFFSDTGPLPEVEAAVRAGLGVRGLHRQLIHPVYGSLCFLAEIVTDLPVEPDTPASPAVCDQCGRCLKACPSGALTADGLDRSRCRSAVTQKKGALSLWEKKQIQAGGLVWGCDCCALACPHNQGLPLTPIAAFRKDPEPLLTRENLARLAAGRCYGWRGESVLARNLDLLGRKTP